MHDALALGIAEDPSLITHSRKSKVDVECRGEHTRGMTVADWRGHWGRHPNAHIGVQVDPEAFFDRFIARVGPFAATLG